MRRPGAARTRFRDGRELREGILKSPLYSAIGKSLKIPSLSSLPSLTRTKGAQKYWKVEKYPRLDKPVKGLNDLPSTNIHPSPGIARYQDII
jgi:hypothetical protein